MFKKETKGLFFVFIFLQFGNLLLSQSAAQSRRPVDTSIPLSWVNGYTLVVLQNCDMLSVNEAKDFIIREGGAIAIYSNAHAMLGWIPPSLADKIVGEHGIEAVYFDPVDPESLKYRDGFTVSLTRFFNSVAKGEVAEAYAAPHLQGEPLIDDGLEHPFADPNAVLKNLEDKHVSWDREIEKTTENRGVFSGYSDSMIGTIAVCLMFVESDGSIDGNYYTWSTSARDLVLDQCLSGASWWADAASLYGVSVSFYVYYYDPTSSVMSQGYEPVLHSSADDGLWIERTMANIGFSSGTKIDRVTSFNAWLKSWAGTDWAYSCFVAYNPPGASTTFANGSFAYSYLGGPYIQMLYRNNGWSTSDIWSIFAHQTGHVFWACSEYYQEGYGGCTNCSPCSSYRPISNGNCEHSSCNPKGSVPCIMRYDENAICSYTAAQVGWQPATQTLVIQSGTGGTTNPVPGTFTLGLGYPVQVLALPNTNYEFLGWTGSVSSTQNPLTVAMNASKTIKANFRAKPRLTIQSSSFGKTSPGSGTYIYSTGELVQVTAIADTYAVFTGWTGSATGSDNPLSLTMAGDKSITANFRYIYAPIPSGQKAVNRTFSQVEYIDVVSWQANPANDGLDIAGYRVYRVVNGTSTLLAEVRADDSSYTLRNAGRESSQYSIAAVTGGGREGAAASITIQ
jgi:hypothetical protein